MNFQIVKTGPVAVYRQIELAVMASIAGGELQEGDQLPTVKKFAAQLDVNFNTVAKSYRTLELWGVIRNRRGVGCFIQSEAQAICREKLSQELNQLLENVVNVAKASGISKKKLTAMISSLWTA